MIYYILADGWINYYASSPFYNVIKDREILERAYNCAIFVISTEITYSKMQTKLREDKPTAIVCDSIVYDKFSDFDGPRLLWIDDLHRYKSEDRDRRQREINWSTATLNAYTLANRRPSRFFFPEDLKKLVFFPHNVSCQEIEVPSFETRKDTLLVPGSRNPAVYPMRAFAASLPNAEIFMQKTHKNDFVAELGKYKSIFTCNLVLGYTVAKYFEIPKAGAVLVGADMNTDEERTLLGFKHGENCLLIQDTDSLKTLPQPNVEMAERGHQLVMKKHTILNRFRQVEIIIEMLLAGKSLDDCRVGSYIKAQEEAENE